MRDGFIPDSQYNYRMNFKNDRPYAPGHIVPNITCEDTDVTLLRKIVDLYIDTSSEDAIEDFTEYKIDFSVNFLDTLLKVYKDKFDEANAMLSEISKQESDIAHQIIKPTLTAGKPLPDNEKLTLYNEMEQLYIHRRKVKDAVLALKVLVEHAEKSRNYILGMNKRKFMPSSEKYTDNDDFNIPSKQEALKDGD